MPAADPPALVQPITRALAELQTSIVSQGVRAFDGWLERFVIYTLIARLSGFDDGEAATPISVHALAASLGQPYETVRRHVGALATAELCVRDRDGIRADAAGLQRPHMAQLVRATHDSFVRFVEHLAASGEALPDTRQVAYHPATGIRAAADIMLAVSDTNRAKHAGWLDLVLFSTVLAGNCRRVPLDATPSLALKPIGAAAVARTIGIGQATVSRHLAAMARTGQLRRVREGYRVSRAWLDDPAAQAVTRLSQQNVRRLLAGVACRGFPFDEPARAYLDGQPPLTPIV